MKINILSNHKIVFSIFFIGFFLSTTVVKSQTCEVTISSPVGITVCDESETISINVTNTYSTTMYNVTMNLILPTGIQYSAGSIVESSSYNVHEFNITNLSSVFFLANSLPADSTISFTVDILAKMASIDYVLAGNTLRNQLNVTSTTASGSGTSPAYNLYYGVLNILSISPSSHSMYAGETYTRTITISNNGNGRVSSFNLKDIHDTGITVTNVDNGTLSANSDYISFDNSDFASVGNGDGYFDSNESISVTETILASGCQSGTISSVFSTTWGCDSERESATSNASTTISLATPSISVSTTSDLSTCFGSGDASTQSITLTNNGVGIADNVQLDIYKSTGNGYDQTIFSRIDENSISYSLDGASSVSITPTQTYTTDNSGRYSCLGSNPIGRVILNLPNLASGSSVTVYFDTYQCNIDVTEGDLIKGWDYSLTYDDVCGTNSYSKSGTGQNENNTNISVFEEIPTDIRNGETLEYNFTLDQFNNDLPQGDGARYKVVFQLPAGISYSSLEFYHNVAWPAHSLSYNTGNNTVTATYELPTPSNFDLENAIFNLKLTGDCSMQGASAGYLPIVSSFYYTTDTTCLTEEPFFTDDTVYTTLHCGNTGGEGMDFYQFDLERTSLGSPDNDQNGLPDASGSLDYTRIKLNRFMFGDTMKCVYHGIVYTSGSHPSWDYAYASSLIDNGENLSNIEAVVTVYDASAGTYLNCNQVPYTTTTNSGQRTIKYDISPVTLAAINGSFTGFSYEDNDSVTLTVKYRVTGNVGGNIQSNTMQNTYYTSDIANPSSSSDKYSIDQYDGIFTLTGSYFTNTYVSYYNVNSCEKEVSQNFYFGLAGKYAGGNFFPSEYRNWAHVKKAQVHIPMYYDVVGARVKYVRTVSTDKTSTQNVYDITPEAINGTYYTYNLEQYYEDFGGAVPYSDDGFKGTLYLTLAPTNDALHDTYQDIDWKFTFAQSDYIGGGVTDWVSGSPDRIKFTPSDLSVTSNTPTVDGLDKTVTWDLKVRNTSSSADANNAWIHLKNPSGDITIDYLIDDDTNDTLTLSSDYYPIGYINAGETRDFSVVAHYSSCSQDYLTAYAGYQCSGYPGSFGTFNGDVYSTGLFVDPKPSSWQASLTGEMVGDACGHSCDVYLTLTNVHFATIDSIDITLTPVGNSMTYQTGTTEILYPSTSSYTTTSDPEVSGSGYIYHLGNLNSSIAENGLMGILHTNYNTVKLHFSMTLENGFTNGDYLNVSINGQQVCGSSVPTLTVAYDPSVGFSSSSGTGLTSDNINSWAASWADYNNDGYDDLFVTTYDDSEPNYLYENNGDGTFTRITTGDIVNDKASSLAAAWADYDNDGNIDLFVANNVGSHNFLYHNNGNGTFTKITSSVVVTEGIYCHSASWADYDNDGYVDLFVAEYFPTKTNHLFHNNGDGTFSSVTGNPVVLDAGHSIGAAWGDYNNDGLIDLFVPNTDGDKNYLYKNIGNGKFEKVDEDVLSTPSKSVGCSWGDYNNDGYLDLFIANAGNEDNFLYKNNGDGTFVKINSGDITSDGGNSHGSTWIDIDNDGDLDIIVTNDQDGDNFMYKNNGDGTFTKLDNILTQAGGNSFGVAISDYDQDGDYDVFMANHEDSQNFFFENTKGQCSSHLSIKLIGTNSNYSAIGARIRVKATINGQPTWQTRQITSQSGGGSGSENSLQTIFGLSDATTADSIIIDWPSGFRQVYTNVDVSTQPQHTYVEENGAHISGIAYLDANENGSFDSGESLIKNVQINLTPLGLTTYTDENGSYSFYLNNGDYSISATAPTYYSQLTPGSGQGYDVAVTDIGTNYSGNDFGYRATSASPDLSIDISTTMLRKGFTNEYAIHYQNVGTTTAYNDTIKFVLVNGLIPVSSSVEWDLKDADTIYWYLQGIAPQEDVIFYLTDSVADPLNVGDNVTCSAEISTGTTEADYSNNNIQDGNTVYGAIDPNDKQVFPSDKVNPGEYLTYKIRFQNVGNYPAENIVVWDTLSDDLDIKTLSHVMTSHPSHLTIIDNYILRWEFDHINLMDSIHNEKESHGYVQFKIKPVEDLPIGRTISNQATIVFDYYQNMTTNNTHVDFGPDFYYDGVSTLLVYPNPATTSVETQFKVNNDNEGLISLYNMQGQKVYEVACKFHKGWNNKTISLINISKGTYFLRFQTENEVENKKLIIIK